MNRPQAPRRFLEIAGDLQSEVNRLGMAPGRGKETTGLGDLFDATINLEPLLSTTRRLFIDGHYAEAVEEAYKCVNNLVKAKSGSDRDGADLMLQVFDADKPVLTLNQLRTTSDIDEQKGYRFMFAGAMTGVRNPRAHAHDLRDDAQAALELIVWAHHLVRILARAKRVRRSTSRGTLK